MLIQLLMVAMIHVLQTPQLVVQLIKFSGNVLIVGEKMPHLISQIGINANRFGDPIGWSILLLTQHIQITNHKFTINTEYTICQSLRKP